MVVSLNEAGVTNDQQQVQSQNKKFSLNILVLQDQATKKNDSETSSGTAMSNKSAKKKIGPNK